MSLDIIQARLQNQLLRRTEFNEPEQVVTWFGAVQSQDYAGAKWALGMRMKGAAEAAIDKSFNEGTILRTHVLRPTWHFVTPTDIRWMLALTAPRIRLALAYNDRKLGLERTVFKKIGTAFERALQDNQQLTRSELVPVLKRAGIPVDGLRLGHVLMHAELDGVICSGARKGRQFTYALLEERAPQAASLTRNEALAELSRRYFRGHGPATAQDFAWWSGLTMTDVRSGIEAVQSELEYETVEGQTYWFTGSSLLDPSTQKAYLLPNYDEYTVGYKERSAIFDAAHIDKLGARASILAQSILINGQVAGVWKRTLHRDRIIVELAPFVSLDRRQNQQVTRAVRRYGEFLGLPVELVI
jgi:hypothetical protein